MALIAARLTSRRLATFCPGAALLLAAAPAVAAAQSSRACDSAPTWTGSFAPALADSARLFRGTFSADGRTLYYFKKVTPGQEDYRIYLSRLTGGGWTPGERLDLGGDFSDLYPNVSPDGKRLVFVSYRAAPGDTAAQPNGYIWYADRRGNGWGPPVFVAAANLSGTYHSGVLISADYSIQFHRTSGDWRTMWEFASRWDGRRYLPAMELPKTHPVERWRNWRSGEYHVWGGAVAPTGDFLTLSISAINPFNGNRRAAQTWISLRHGDGWSEPWPAGGGASEQPANFLVFHPNGCEVVFVRNYSTFHRVSIEALTAPARAHVGEVMVTPVRSLLGFYRGAYLRGNGVQLVDAEVVRQGDTVKIAMVTPDWPLLGARIATVLRDSGGRYGFATPFGQASLRFDSLHGELAGSVGRGTPPISLQLKRELPPPLPAILREDITILRGGVSLAGTLIRPRDVPVTTALMVVSGRGCASRAGGVRLLERLAPFGVAGLALDKRGVAQSGGNCRFGTIGQFTDDALAGFAALASRFNRDSVRVGFLGTSAGGWTVVRAAARSPVLVDFLITNVGPAVSVEAQQRDNARYITHRLGFSPAQRAQAMRYLDLMFARGNQAARYAEMQRLVAWAKDVGFADEFFDESDIPASVAAVDSLWVTLNDYDPGPDLRKLKLPLLAFFGEEDEVVPPRENVAALRAHAAANPDLQARIVVVPGGNHGLRFAEGVTDLGGDDRQFRFDRLSPMYLETVVDFLRAVRR